MSKKNFLKNVLCLCLMALCWMPVKAQGEALRGDVNSDGSVNISDAIALINGVLLSETSAIDVAAADVNGDGQINISDAIMLINYVLNDEWPYEPVIETFTVGNVSFNMVYVKGGTFMMGATDEDEYARPWEKPAHEVTLSDYYIGETEVTQALWKAVMGTNPSWFTSSNGYANDLTRPVEHVSYANCKSFINRLNQKTGRTFRMLTEAEWEFAARGGCYSKGYRYAGSNDVDEVAWYKETSGEITHSVATKAPNELGLYDMSGNVEEWCADYYSLYTADSQTNPTGGTSGNARISRGGCWDQSFRNCRVTCRYDAPPAMSTHHYGLRIALTE